MKQKKWRNKLMILFSVLMLVGSIGLLASGSALAAGGDITISGPGLNSTKPVVITQAQLQGKESVSEGVYLEQQDVIYSTINTWPTKSWYRGQGVKVTDLLKAAGGIKPEATQIKFKSRDGFEATFTVDELLNTQRYCYPYFMDTGLPGHLPGDASDAVEVPAIIAHRSFYTHSYEDILDDENFNRSDANLLLYGQRAVTQQTNARFAKYVTKIEVLTEPVSKWDNPTATPAPPAPGVVPAGTMVELHSPFDDEDKVHYTLDGSDPTIESPMYNWIASRWWSSRADELNTINRPIEITRDTTIKAKVIGPGRLDSDIVTFFYQVPDPPALSADDTDNVIGQPVDLTFTDDAAWRAAITGITVDGIALTGDQYMVTEGNIRITADVFPVAKEYTIVVKAAGYEDACVTQTIVSGLPAPPKLKADDTDNVIGQPVDLTFTDDAAWRAAITGITVDGSALTVGQYAVTEGNIRIIADVFTEAKDYTIVIKAEGYDDARVTQKIKTPGSGGGPGDPDGDVVLTITGDGVSTEKKYTLKQLQDKKQYQQVYSAINTWPSKKWYVGKGVKLKDLLDEAGMKSSARLITFTASDGFRRTLTVQELLNTPRYCFPNFMGDGQDGNGHIPGSSAGKVQVDVILGLESAEGTDDPSYMNSLNALLLMLGQRAVTEQNGELFVKNLERIEVSTEAPDQWDEPKAEPDSGEVPPGTLVRLSSEYNDNDKIYYTTDGSTPTLESPMYNWIASRWWSARADVLDTINKPIEITKDTTIKAKVIGPGKKDSDVVTFTYKVKEDPVKSSTVSREGGIVEYVEEDGSSTAVIEIPAGALTNANAEVGIQKLSVPPAVPSGYKLLSSVYEFLVDGQKSYNFAKEVTIKLSFDPSAVGEGETPAIYYYDEELKQWVSLGGEISGNTISIRVNHFTKFAVMVAGEPEVATGLIMPDEGGTVSLGSEAAIEIPAGALTGRSAVEVKIEKVTNPPAAPAGFKPAGSVYEFSVDGKRSYTFARTVTIKLGFDPGTAGEGDAPAIYCYDEELKQWAKLGGEVSGNTITVQVDHFTMFAVMVPVKESSLTDIAGHWAFDNINKLLAMGYISGYPDRTFRPDHPISRAEFITVLVKAFGLEHKQGRSFADSAGHWAEKYIAAAATCGIANGYDDDTFGPDDLITREQMAVMFVKAAKLEPAAGSLTFTDSDGISGWAVEAVNTAAAHGIMKGYPDNTIRPKGNATRAEAVTVILNALNINPSNN
ncbi:MAG: S-layer homology domain-containing protein [Peptococcaceae bacterium MAG4]|nr:S-layer homology domain-containing protein [Peptococcaceae bacterium MAG4]